MSPRITPVDPAQATGKARALLDAVQAKLGLTPNLMRTMAISPAVLEGYLHLSGALSGGTLSARVREQVALTVAEVNACDYCLSAHAAIGKMVGLTGQDIASARSGVASEAKADAALKFARAVVELRGQVSDADVQKAQAAGLTDGEVLELVANVALNVLTNYLNHVAGTAIDFPRVTARAA